MRYPNFIFKMRSSLKIAGLVCSLGVGLFANVNLACGQSMLTEVTFSEARCVSLVRDVLLECGHEFSPKYVCACLGSACAWHTRCSHDDVPEAGYDATIGFKFGDGGRAAYLKALSKAEEILESEMRADLKLREAQAE